MAVVIELGEVAINGAQRNIHAKIAKIPPRFFELLLAFSAFKADFRRSRRCVAA